MSTQVGRERRPKSPRPKLTDFFQQIAEYNPFSRNRVCELSPTDVDVRSIHEEEFRRLVELAERARDEQRGIGAVLWGEAGVGKSHLLGRLARWSSHNDRATYVFLHNVQASAERLPRYILKCVVSRLTEGRTAQFYQTPLFGLVNQAVKQAVQRQSISKITWTKSQQAYDQFVDRLAVSNATQAGSRIAYHVLFEFFRSVYRDEKGYDADDAVAGLAVRWLSGELLDAEDARCLGLHQGQRPGRPVSIVDNQEIENVLLTLTQLALLRRQPFILCFDQADNLDEDQIRELTRFFQVMLDHAGNLLVVTTGVKNTLLDFHSRGAIGDAPWDRIAEYKIDLHRIKPADGRKIVEARLEPFLDPFTHLAQVKQLRQEDTLFPLGRLWLENRTADVIDLRPRDIISWARDAWEKQQERLAEMSGPKWLEKWPLVHRPVGRPPTEQEIIKAIDKTVSVKVQEQINQRRVEPATLPPDADNLCGLVEGLLKQCLDHGDRYTIRDVERQKPAKRGLRPTYDLLVREWRKEDHAEVSTGVVFLTTASATSTAYALRRILHDQQRPTHVLLVTEQQRRPLRLGPKGKQYFAELADPQGYRFKHVPLTFAQYAELDALQAVVGMARSGELEVDVRGRVHQVSEPEVIQSHHRRGRYCAHVLLRELLTEEPPPPAPPTSPGRPSNQEGRQFVMAGVALTMGTTTHALAKKYVQEHAAMRLDLEKVEGRFKEIASQLHKQGHVHCTPHNGGYFIAWKPH